MTSSPISKGMAKWLEDFIGTLAENKKELVSEINDSSTEKVAEINIHDLQKVVWNDETFYVMFEGETATVLNEFGNTVTTVKATNIDEVDQILNSKQIVAEDESSNVFEEELKKASAYLNITAEDVVTPDNFTNTTPNQQVPQPQINQPQDPNQVQNPAPQPVDQTQQEVDEVQQQTASANAPFTIKADGLMFNGVNIVAKIAELEENLNKANTQIELLSQQYAHMDPGAVYDNNAQSAEMQHVQETANATQQGIEQEHQIDLSTPAGRVSLKDRLKSEINEIMNTEMPDVDMEQEVDETPEESVEQVEEPVEETQEETTETPEVPEIPESEEPVDSEEINTSIPTEMKPPKAVLDQMPGESTETEVEEETSNESEETEEKPNEKKEQIVKLNSRDSKIFKKAVCPECGGELIKSKSVKAMVGVYCSDCKIEYAVNLDNEDIYKKLN